MSIFLE